MPQQVDILPEDSLTDERKNSHVKRQVVISFLSFLPGTLIEGVYLLLHLFIHLLLPYFFILLLAPITAGILLSITAIQADIRGRLWLYRRRVGIEQAWRYKVLINPQVYDASITPVNSTTGLSLQEHVDAQIQCYLLLGAAGSGKTKALSYLLQSELNNHLRDMSRNDRAIPTFVSLKDYSDFLKVSYPLNNTASPAVDIQSGTLYTYLSDSKIKSLRCLRPHLSRWMAEERIWFFFDGLNEIDERYQDVICTELFKLRETKNAIITCREIDYHQNPLFAQLSAEDDASLIIMKPLEENEQDAFIRSYIEKGFVDEHGKRWRSTSEQIIDFITEKQLRSECSNPQILFTLMQTIDDIGITNEINTLGKLLRKSVSRRIDAQQPEWQELDFSKEELIYYIGEIACTMRRMKYVSGFSLHTPSPTHREKPYSAWAEELREFIEASDVKDAHSIHRGPISKTHAFLPSQREHMLRFAAEAGLLSINANSILDFDYKSMAEYFVAEFLRVSDTGSQLPYRKELIDTERYWNEPIHIWAGLLDDPMLLARRFGELGIVCKDEEGDRSYNALTSGLMCLGVHWIHSFGSYGEQKLPDSLYDLFKSNLVNNDRRERLAIIFERCAQEGSDVVYRPLLRLLTLKGADELLFALPRPPIQQLLFEYLEHIAETPSYGKDVEALEYILGRMNDDRTFQWALTQSQPASLQPPERSVRLRQAAISVLGALQRKEALETLLPYLSEQDAIKDRVIEALSQMKLDDVLGSLLHYLISPITPATERRQIAILNIVGTFLKSAGPISHQEIVKQLLHILSSSYQPLHKDAKKLLKEEATSGQHYEDVRKTLVAALVSPGADQVTIHNLQEILVYVGDKVTGTLLEYVHQPVTKVSDNMKVRIIEVLGKTQDHSALNTLYNLVAYDNLPLRNEVARALSTYPLEKVVPVLIDKVLNKSDKEAYASMNALQEYGPQSVELISSHLADYALPERVILLVQSLHFFHDRKAIPALNNLLRTKPASQVAIGIIKTLQTFNNSADPESVSILLQVLRTNYKDKDVYNVISETFSLYGEPILPALLSELENAQPGRSRAEIMRAISKMQPFPYQPLLNAFRSSNEAQIMLVRALFIEKEKEGARFLVKHLCHPESSIQRNVHITIEDLGKKNAILIIEPLVDELSESHCHHIVIQYLRSYASTAIPQLAMRLGNEYTGKIACETLIEMSSLVIDRLPDLIPALNKPQSSSEFRHARQVLIGIVNKEQQFSQQIIDLFRYLADSSKQQAYDALVEIISTSLAQRSVSVLLQNLASEHAPIQQGVIESLIKIGRDDTTPRGNIVTDGLLAALGMEEKRNSAERALKGIGAKAVNSVYALIMDSNPEVRKCARNIVIDMGALAFELLFHDLEALQLERRVAAESIIIQMKPEAIKDPLIQLLASNDIKQVEQGLILLFGHVRADTHTTTGRKKMLTVLLEHIQTHPTSQQTLSVIASLLSLPLRQELLEALVEVLSNYPQTQQWLSPLFLLLALEGSKAKDSLLILIQKGFNLSHPLYKELIGILGLLEPHRHVTDLAQSLGKHAQSFPNTLDLQQLYEVELSRHALGSLLIGKHWDSSQLLKLRSSAADGSTQHELFSILLGDSYLPRIETLHRDLDNEKVMRIRESQGQQSLIETQQEEIRQLQRQINQQNDALRQHNNDLLEARTFLMEKENHIAQLTVERNTAQQNEYLLYSDTRSANERNAQLYQDLQEALGENYHLNEEITRLRYLSGYS